MATLLTKAECAEILRNACGTEAVSLLDIRIDKALGTLGYLGEYFQLRISFVRHDQKPEENNAKRHSGAECEILNSFVKALPSKSAEAEKENIFSKEAKLYGTLFKELERFSSTKWFPKIYYTRSDLIVMEDLKAQGYEHCKNPCSSSLDEFEMKQILSGLAGMHASSLVYEIIEAVNMEELYGELLREITISPQVSWCTTGLKALLAIAKKHPKYQAKHIQDLMADTLVHKLQTIYGMTNASPKYRNVLCHRDMWTGNIFFDYRLPSSAIFVDYQTCRYCPPGIDLIFALHLNLTRAERLSKQDFYIDWYYGRLSKDLQQFGISAETLLPRLQLISAYRDFELLGHVYRALAFTILKVPPALVTNEYKYVERTEQVLGLMEKDEEFRQIMEDCIEDILELVLGAS